jgi:NTP pyrophosphatase (non-canonical NTP hydrolase)
MNIRELQDRAHTHAAEKGFWDDYNVTIAKCLLDKNPEMVEPIRAAFIGQKLALIHSEVTEALEEVREGNYSATHSPGGKPEGLPSELADVVIRVADLCGALNIDLQATIEEKLAYNAAARGHKHGKKF